MGTWIPASGAGPTNPVYTGPWAGLMAGYPAAAFSGRKACITSPFPAEFVSDGVKWRPLNGRALVSAQAGSTTSPLSTLTGNGTTQTFVLPSDILLPAGMLQPRLQLEIRCFARKNGTHTGRFRVALATSPAGENAIAVTLAVSLAANSSWWRSASTVAILNNEITYSGNPSDFSPAGGIASTVAGSTPISNLQTIDRHVVFSIDNTYIDSLAELFMVNVALVG